MGMKYNRRYYLHRRLKSLFRIDAHARILYYHEATFDHMTDHQVKYFVELQLRYKYSAQSQIK